MRKHTLTIAACIIATGIAEPALAHTGIGTPTHGFLAGLAHPLGGPDHLLAMVAVGIWSALVIPSRAWLAPAAFLSAMLAGAGLAAAGLAVPALEIGIALSVVLLGLMIATRFRTGAATGAAIVAAFAIFHGNAHGLEATGAMTAYITGFSLATGLLHVIGLGIGRLIARARYAAPALGSVAAGAGFYFLFT